MLFRSNGTVEKIGLRSTRIRTNDKTYVSIPNKQMVDTIVDDFSLRNKRRGELNLYLDLKTSLNQINQLLNGLDKVLMIEGVSEKTILLNDLKIDAYQVSIEYFTEPGPISSFNATKQLIHLNVLALLEELGIEIAGKNKVVG